jgi:predicted nucleic-acid-binding Zn-ribbon protein
MNESISLFLSNLMIILILSCIYYLFYIKIMNVESPLNDFIMSNESLKKLKTESIKKRKDIFITGFFLSSIFIIIFNSFYLNNNDNCNYNESIEQEIFLEEFQN